MYKQLESLIDKAIQKEEEAFAFYGELQDRVQDQVAKDTLRFLAQEEQKHKEYLVRYRSGGFAGAPPTINEPDRCRVAAFYEKPDIDKNMQSKDVYLVAAHREWNAYEFYRNLADLYPAGEVKDLFLNMAAQELKHKEKMEYLYANTVFVQTAGG